MPDEFVVDVDLLSEDQLHKLAIIAVSYCWISQPHPDPALHHLRTLYHLCRCFIAGRASDRKDVQYKVPNQNYKRTPSGLQEDGWVLGCGDGRPAGIFLDWMSIPQDKPKGSRTPEDQEIFERALESINMW